MAEINKIRLNKNSDERKTIHVSGAHVSSFLVIQFNIRLQFLFNHLRFRSVAFRYTVRNVFKIALVTPRASRYIEAGAKKNIDISISCATDTRLY